MPEGLSRLFSPAKIGERTSKNRIVSAAHNTNLDSGGVLSQEYANYIVRRAQGGPGMVVCFGAASVHEPCGAMQRRVSLWSEANEGLLSEIAKRAHSEDCLVVSQAAHIGRRGDSSRTGLPLQAPSEVPEPVHLEIPHALTKGEICAIIESFANAARRLEGCGWDGIEITSYAGQLIEQFWSPTVNLRDDEYGGDLEGRMRFSVEVVQAVRLAVSREFVVGFRMTGDPGAASSELELDRANMLEIAARLNELNAMDYFHISGSSGATKEGHAGIVPPVSYPAGCYLPLARAVKAVVSVPVLGTGRVMTAEQGERALEAGDCDLVGMVRALIADPDLPKKAQAGLLSTVRPCISVISGCSGRLGRGATLGCSVNPSIAYPELENHPPIALKRKVVVVGGGVAGLEAARVSALRGHDVALFERMPMVGGQLLSAARAPGREDFLGYVDWLDRETSRLGVEKALGVECSASDLALLVPDVVIGATGSKSGVPVFFESRIQLVSDVEVLDGHVVITPDSNVLVYDIEGGYRGGSVANIVAEAGAQSVELATPLGTVCQELDKLQQPSMYQNLCRNLVQWSPNMKLSEDDSGFILTHLWSGADRRLGPVNIIVFVGYRRANTEFYDVSKLFKDGMELHLVGDCLAPRRMFDATADGIRAGNAV